MGPVGTRITSGNLTNAADLVITTGSINVCGVVISFVSGNTKQISMKTGDGSEILHIFPTNVTDDIHLEFHIPFLADKGLSFSSNSADSIFVTVFHRSVGA